ncbi:asparaginase [Ilumatobacter sp.]|uniref:asparaginase n=1 Tax=Ilumatobacter sp. TaxID=1967498 RepID=UPI003B52821D
MGSTPGTRFSPASFRPLVVATRDGVDESIHAGAAVVVDADGVIVDAVGDPELAVFPRSALKPFQASAMVRAGLDLPDRTLAVVVASHSGERVHLAAVEEILRTHDLGVDDLANTADHPLGSEERTAAIAAGEARSALRQNCSGKHAGMLATCRVNDWPIDTYLERDHPLQRAIVGEIERLADRAGSSVVAIGVDGCGAPTHVMALADAARALSRLVVEGSPVRRAMRAHPDLVGGTGRDVTRWMVAVDGLVAKEGAAGVLVAALADGTAGALKIADGSDAARRVATVELLRRLGVDVDGVHAAVADLVGEPVLGHGRPVGAMRALEWS